MLGLNLCLLPPPPCHCLQRAAAQLLSILGALRSWDTGRACVLLHTASPPSAGPFNPVPAHRNKQDAEPEQTFHDPEYFTLPR